ncbi:hypothetical protein S40293_04172 [Stachybotrys chartarum IBT 40293]|nr:hypothetical protein S40293_04172 [Stachybotrys chartarum IBT 40293]
MAREKRALPAAVTRGPKERHRKANRPQYDRRAPVPVGFVAKPAIPKLKHHTYLELVENKDKKQKRLEFEITSKKTPPPGFEFVPIGNPELTTACKELSRERDAMMFIVSDTRDSDPNPIAHQMNRIGHHIRESIVEEARANLNHWPLVGNTPLKTNGLPEPIPTSQEEYNRQVDAVLRDLFPRIPHTDRQMIIEHAFDLRSSSRGANKPVGLSADIPLSRRVQLAVLAHIRHSHTRYDTLLKETSWQNSRKVVEQLCLDILVKWRGDEESGRDQLDEILREVVVISDSEEDESDTDPSEPSSMDIDVAPTPSVPTMLPPTASHPPGLDRHRTPKSGSKKKGAAKNKANKKAKAAGTHARTADKSSQRGFKRYQQAWNDAVQRSRDENCAPCPAAGNPDFHHGHPDASQDLSQEIHYRNGSGSHTTGPDSHGYFSVRSRPPPAPGLQSAFVPSGQPIYEKVTSMGHEQPSGVPTFGQWNNSVSRPVQDLLVRSIEPGSPTSMQPSFVRSLPPREDVPANPSFVPVMHRRGNLDSTPADPPSGLNAPFNRRVVSDGHASETMFPGGFIEVHSSNPQLPRAYPGRVPPRHDDFHGPATPTRASGLQYERREVPRAANDVPVGDVARHPVVIMEDRGGFYERVRPAESSVSHDPNRHPQLHQLPSNAQILAEPRRIVSMDGGQRIYWEREDVHAAGVTPFSTTSANLPAKHGRHEAETRGILAEQSYDIRHNNLERPHPVRQPLPREGYMVPAPPSFQRLENPHGAHGHPAQAHMEPGRHHRNGPPAQNGSNRGQDNLRRRQPEHVIVLD